MNIIISGHARSRMKERAIHEIDIWQTLLQPESVSQDTTYPNRFLAKRRYVVRKQSYLLLVIYEVRDERLEVITVISTSKMDKYL